MPPRRQAPTGVREPPPSRTGRRRAGRLLEPGPCPPQHRPLLAGRSRPAGRTRARPRRPRPPPTEPAAARESRPPGQSMAGPTDQAWARSVPGPASSHPERPPLAPVTTRCEPRARGPAGGRVPRPVRREHWPGPPPGPGAGEVRREGGGSGPTVHTVYGDQQGRRLDAPRPGDGGDTRQLAGQVSGTVWPREQAPGANGERGP